MPSTNTTDRIIPAHCAGDFGSSLANLQPASTARIEFDEMSGVSFLPHFDHVYQQAPYQECDKGEYNDMIAKMDGNIDWNRLLDYENEDATAGSQTFACSGDSCEIVDIGA